MEKSNDNSSASIRLDSSYLTEKYRKEWEERRRLSREQEIEEQKRIISELEKEKDRQTTEFINQYSPSRIEAELNEYIMDQCDLTRAVSDFLYYQALRYKYPHIHSWPLLICGPSGSGKTEVWRVAKKLYSEFFRIKIINAANITSDGWSGSNKLANYLTREASNSILVLDKANKMMNPRYSISNVNVSADLQAEFLKVIEENEYLVSSKIGNDYVIKNLGVVFIGAFERIRKDKTQPISQSIGFESQKTEQPEYCGITETDLLEYGVIPELLGRISVITNTKPIGVEQCLKIVRNSKSGLAEIAELLETYGINAWKDLPDKVIIEMIKNSDIEKFGVRTVLSKMETVMLQGIRENGLTILANSVEHAVYSFSSAFSSCSLPINILMPSVLS